MTPQLIRRVQRVVGTIKLIEKYPKHKSKICEAALQDIPNLQRLQDGAIWPSR